MDNPYITQVAPYFGQQDQGLQPVFQNIGQQQALHNQLLQQQQQNNQQLMQPKQGGSNPMLMAAMLRGTQPQSNADAAKMNSFEAYLPWNQMSTANQYGTDPYSQQSTMLASQDAGMK
jgi:hypothetical protein